ncbi:hypothetical protein H5410_003973 [Solanum commersonii]|uniref:Uncharacterized protein n=1 Tax=Solanum commersonii TaxID=4109 RepID=A0A9J6B6G9_SOLCO|nr:hypothetical protein H5410_003973 [Solanum commersonii]
MGLTMRSPQQEDQLDRTEFRLVSSECPIFVDLQLGSPPLAIDGEKHNKGPILLCDDEESEKTVKLIGKIFLKILIILQIESSSLLDIDGFRASDSSADNDSPIYGKGYVWDLNSPNAKVTLYPHRGGFEFMWNALLEIYLLRD